MRNTPKSRPRLRPAREKFWVLLPAVRRGYENEVFLGVRAGLAESPNVELAWSLDPDDLLARWGQAGHSGVGVIIGHWKPTTLRKLERLPCAVADFSHRYTPTGGTTPLPSRWRAYAPDDIGIGRMLAHHFAERRLACTGCINPYPAKSNTWAAMRIQGFCAEAGEKSVAKFLFPNQRPEKLRAWLCRLPKPAGVFCVTDKEAAQAAELCRQNGLAVPEQVALAGVNNDPVWVESASPALTSVLLPTHDIGLALARAASTRLRTLHWPLDDVILLAPRTLFSRASTNPLAIKDPRLLAAVTFIRAREGQGIGVDDVCSAVGLNRRSMELLFRKHLGHAPYASIQAARLEKARTLIVHSTLPITEIASHCHLPIDRFGALFRKHYGLLPLTLRREERRLLS